MGSSEEAFASISDDNEEGCKQLLALYYESYVIQNLV